jgi:NADH-quinone oxidoreductase subunit C
MTPEDVMARVAALLPSAVPAPPEHARGQAVITVARESILETLRTLRDQPDLAFDVLTDLTAVDYLGREPRFEVVYQLNSLTNEHRMCVME